MTDRKRKYIQDLTWVYSTQWLEWVIGVRSILQALYLGWRAYSHHELDSDIYFALLLFLGGVMTIHALCSDNIRARTRAMFTLGLISGGILVHQMWTAPLSSEILTYLTTALASSLVYFVHLLRGRIHEA